MTIIKDGKTIAELPDKPGFFDAYINDGQITLAIRGTEIKLARYESNDTAGAIVRELCKSYLSGAQTFTLPEGAQKKIMRPDGHTNESWEVKYSIKRARRQVPFGGL